MTRVSLFDDDEEPRPRVRRAAPAEVPATDAEPQDLAGLMLQMTTVLNIKTAQGGPWHARALGAYGFGSGDTPEAAMRNALALRAKEKSK